LSHARWVALDGVEACGKSTQAGLLAGALDAVLTREPGGTAIGARLRSIVLDPDHAELDARAEALIYASDRAQHVAEVVAPALSAGRHVVSDRSFGSSLAYQGYGRGLALDEVALVNRWAMAGRSPDLVVLLRLGVDESLRRLGAERDRLEREDLDFHRRVADGFDRLAAADPALWVVVDGSGEVRAVSDRLRAAVRERLGL
jgi:dTMP kinase